MISYGKGRKGSSNLLLPPGDKAGGGGSVINGGVFQCPNLNKRGVVIKSGGGSCFQYISIEIRKKNRKCNKRRSPTKVRGDQKFLEFLISVPPAYKAGESSEGDG